MSSDRPHRHHGIDYIELAVTDMEAAKRFYTQAFGWTFTDYSPGYVGFSDGRPGEAGGLYKADTVVAGTSFIILASAKLEASRDAVTAAGGRLTKDIYEFPGGRRFEFLDPAGNQLGVWGE